MRLLATLLSVLLLTLGLGLGGYSALLACRRPTPPPLAVPATPGLPTPAAPHRLDPATMPPPATAPDRDHEAPLLPLQVVVDNLPAALARDRAGLAVFDAGTGGDFRWTPLPATWGAGGAGELTTEARRGAEVWVTVAADRSFARHGYLVRQRHRVASAASGGAPVRLDASASEVRLLLPPDRRQVGPLRLRRCDDPQWLPMAQGSTGLLVTDRSNTTLLLGPGDYEISDPLWTTPGQRFGMPATRELRITAALAPARVGRP